MLTEEQALEALRQVIDPEIGIDIVELGLVYSIDVQPGRVHAAMTMTTRACPLHAVMTEAAEAALRQAAPPGTDVQVEIVWDPPWNPAMMSPAAKQQLGWRG